MTSLVDIELEFMKTMWSRNRTDLQRAVSDAIRLLEEQVVLLERVKLIVERMELLSEKDEKVIRNRAVEIDKHEKVV